MLSIMNDAETSSKIKFEQVLINNFLSSQLQLKKLLSSHMQILSIAIEKIANPVDTNKIHSILLNLKSNLNDINGNINSLKELQEMLNNFQSKNYQISPEDELNYNSFSNDAIEKYNQISINIYNFLIDLQEFTYIQFPENTVDKLEQPSTLNTKDSDSTQINLSSEHNISNDNIQENTLVISEKKGKVYLPYTKNQLNTILESNKNKYFSVQDVIEDCFCVPLSNYKNFGVSRFKEAYKLIKEKEKGSMMDAFNLGLEVFFNYNLHPAIISACRNLNEFDIYLDCLESNETSQFKCFSIIFEVPPKLVD